MWIAGEKNSNEAHEAIEYVDDIKFMFCFAKVLLVVWSFIVKLSQGIFTPVGGDQSSWQIDYDVPYLSCLLLLLWSVSVTSSYYHNCLSGSSIRSEMNFTWGILLSGPILPSAVRWFWDWVEDLFCRNWFYNPFRDLNILLKYCLMSQVLCMSLLYLLLLLLG